MVSEKNDGIVRLRRDDKIRFIAPNTNLSLWLFEKRKIKRCTARWQHRSPPNCWLNPFANDPTASRDRGRVSIPAPTFVISC